jgi:myo-inositol 2-dehydrogenase/D-chiro-inositol 1-dehydrogenase
MVRFGLIGYGLWGQHHATAIAKAPGAELAAISCTEDSVAAARQAFPNVPIYLDYKDLLARSDIDAVDIVVPNHLHCEVGCAALTARKDVLLEKPMALSVADCDRLVEAARNNGRVLTIGHEFRLSEQWGLFKDMIQGGEIGRPLYANVSLFRFPYRPGGGAWRYQPGQVGSWTLEEPVHFFDFLMWYFEPWGDPISVLGLGSAKEGRPVGMNDNFTAVVRWPGPLYAVVTQTLAGFEHHHVVEIVGSEGSIRSWWSGSMDRTREAAYEIKVQRKGQKACEVINIAASGELFELEEELRRAVKAFETRKAIVSGEEARKRIIVCLEAERSLIEGKEIGLQF